MSSSIVQANPAQHDVPQLNAPSLQCVVSRHRQVEARLADVGLHAVNRLASGGADHLGIKQLDDVWSSSGWRKKNYLDVWRL